MKIQDFCSTRTVVKATAKCVSKLLLGGALCASMLGAANAGSHATLSLGTPHIDHNDHSSLQRGAKYYMNFCSGCHSLQYMRYNRLAKDGGITDNDGNVADKLLRDNLIFTGQKVGDLIKTSLDKGTAAKWFGTPPPDLTLEARLRGADWLYNYLLGFYEDPSRPWGVNNVIFKDVGMPHVLAELQGKQRPVYRHHKAADGSDKQTIVGLELAEPGSMKPTEYRQMVNDMVNFLSYTANPVKEQSKRIGYFALLFLSVLFVLSWALKKEYWKDVH